MDFVALASWPAVLVVAAAVVAAAALYLRLSPPSRPPVAFPVGGPTLPLALLRRTPVSHDTFLFRFALPTPAHVAGLGVGSHVALRANIGGAAVQRSYTPVSSDSDAGVMDLVIKVYPPSEAHPAGGLMSLHLASLAVGDTVDVRRVGGRFEYRGRGVVAVRGVERRVASIGLAGGGTGLTPLLQVMRAIARDPEDTTTVRLVYGNRTGDDVLLRSELDEMARDPRFTVHHTLSQPPPACEWADSGRIGDALLARHMPPAGGDTIALLCGPAAMVSHTLVPGLERCGYARSEILCF